MTIPPVGSASSESTLVADVAAAVRLYAPTFAFLPFAAEAAASATSRPALSLILLDEVFDRAEADLRFQGQLLDQVDAAVIATDAHGRITHWNNHAEELFQRKRSEVISHLAGELVMLPPDRSAIR